MHASLFAAGKKGGRGKGGSGRGVRGVDFGLGIGYNPDASSKPQSQSTPSRSAAVNSLKTGMMAQFRSSFVAASSNSEGSSFGASNAPAIKRPTLLGFVSGGSIGGEAPKAQLSAWDSSSKPSRGTDERSRENGSHNSSER